MIETRDLLLHPVRLRIVQALVGASLTPLQLKDRLGDAIESLDEGFALFNCCRYIQKHQFIGTFFSIALRQFNGITCITQINEIDTFDCSSIFYVKTWYDSFCKHSFCHSELVSESF